MSRAGAEEVDAADTVERTDAGLVAEKGEAGNSLMSRIDDDAEEADEQESKLGVGSIEQSCGEWLPQKPSSVLISGELLPLPTSSPTDEELSTHESTRPQQELLRGGNLEEPNKILSVVLSTVADSEIFVDRSALNFLFLTAEARACKMQKDPCYERRQTDLRKKGMLRRKIKDQG